MANEGILAKKAKGIFGKPHIVKVGPRGLGVNDSGGGMTSIFWGQGRVFPPKRGRVNSAFMLFFPTISFYYNFSGEGVSLSAPGGDDSPSCPSLGRREYLHI